MKKEQASEGKEDRGGKAGFQGASLLDGKKTGRRKGRHRREKGGRTGFRGVARSGCKKTGRERRGIERKEKGWRTVHGDNAFGAQQNPGKECNKI